LNEAK
jgi:hypothetical protein